MRRWKRWGPLRKTDARTAAQALNIITEQGYANRYWLLKVGRWSLLFERAES